MYHNIVIRKHLCMERRIFTGKMLKSKRLAKPAVMCFHRRLCERVYVSVLGGEGGASEALCCLVVPALADHTGRGWTLAPGHGSIACL